MLTSGFQYQVQLGGAMAAAAAVAMVNTELCWASGCCLCDSVIVIILTHQGIEVQKSECL